MFNKAIFLAVSLCIGVLLSLELGSAPTSAQPRLSCEWSHSIAVTATAGASTHSDEIRVDLTSADFPTGYSMSGAGADLRVYASDNTTPIPFFISRWDPFVREATVFIRPGSIGAGSSQTFNFFLGNGLVASASDATSVFPVSGLRVLSRSTNADPVSASDGYNSLRLASSTIADVVRSDVFRINNGALGGGNSNYALCVSTLLNVSPAQAGTWDFRGGFDYGRGGHFRLGETSIEEDWNDDLWWAINFGNPDVLQASRALTAGWHRIEALGFEGCCDGPIEIQARPPGGSYQDLRTSNFPLRASICSNIQVTISAAQEACPIGLDVEKTAVEFVDPQGGDFAVPGTVVTYEISIANTGQRVNDTTIDILDTLPADTRLIVTGNDAFELVDGLPASGVSLNWTDASDLGDGVEFSTDGVDFSYVPAPDATGADDAITHVRFVPDGSLNPADNANQPGFVLRLKLVID